MKTDGQTFTFAHLVIEITRGLPASWRKALTNSSAKPGRLIHYDSRSDYCHFFPHDKNLFTATARIERREQIMIPVRPFPCVIELFMGRAV
jgi:hypothetical protein